MFRKFLAFLAVALFLLPAAALAQYDLGDKELTLSGTGSSDNDFNNNDFSVQASLGYFFSDVLEGLIRQQLDVTAREDADDDWNASTAVAVDFHLDLTRWTPFIGAALGYRYGDSVDETWFAGPEGGIKAFLNDSTFVQFLVQYQWFFDSADDVDENFDDGSFIYGLGLGYVW